VLGLIVLVGGVAGVLVWRQVITLDGLRGLLRPGEQKGATTPAPARRPPAPAPATEPSVTPADTVMARDTATGGAPSAGIPPEPRRRLVAPTLPPGVTLTRSVVLVSRLQVESVSQIDAEGKTGYSIVQRLSSGERLILEEFPADTLGAGGEIGVTGIPPDTVVGHVRMADLEVRIKAVGISEDRIVQFLQELVEIKPQIGVP
jgi:hypothetical protein